MARLSELAERKAKLRLLAAEQRVVLAQNLQDLSPLWRLAKIGFLALGVAKGTSVAWSFLHLFRRKKRRRSGSWLSQFLFGFGLARKVLGLFRSRH